MATVWFLFAVLCIATAAPAVKGGKQGVTVVKSETVPQPVLAAKAVFCPDGWFDQDGRCFTLTNSAMDWNSAEDHCKSMGAHLASIHNPADNRFLKQMITLGGQREVWIGSYLLQKRWRWIDGTGMFFQQFISSSSSTKLACTSLNTRSDYWVKASCSTYKRFICSTSPGSC
ncbi:unnamed protein product [Boreogadus saida]